MKYSNSSHRHAAAAACPAPDTLSPADRYAELFALVQLSRVFPDSKTFVDAAPRGEPEAILAAYRAQCRAPGFDLAAFVAAHFDPPAAPASDYASLPGQSLADHIDGLWPTLTRKPEEHRGKSSLLPLPNPYVVPGGRFGELYYWDSYFTMLGLAESGRADLLHAMTDNFAYLIDTYGHVPNGNRTYYLSRSQPPVFALMVELGAAAGGPPAAAYLPQLEKEHAFWMDGGERLLPGAYRRVVRLVDGTLLNRYWDDRGTPREEAWLEDVQTASASGGHVEDACRHLRAAAESGWDFSTRWLAEPEGGGPASTRLADIRTTDILPVDLNALLWKLETTIAGLHRAGGAAAAAARFESLALQRRAAFSNRLWNDADGHFGDHDWRLAAPRRALTAACVVPLFVGVAEQPQADRVAATIESRLLVAGGLATTELTSTEQWDRPNGWAPLQWMAVVGLRRYGHDALAGTIADRWLATVADVYRRDAKLVEKYALRSTDAMPCRGGDGGEYPLQDGFGWTNGVTRRLLIERPEHAAARAEAGGGPA